MNVCISGATGLVGNELVIQNLNNPEVKNVWVLSRKPLPFQHPKCHVILCEFTELTVLQLPEPIDISFCALGTTLRKAGSKAVQQQIDRDFVIQFAQLMQTNGCKSIGVVSSLGAKIDSSNFYLRTKGEMEKGVIDVHIESTNFIRPSLLLGPRNEKRPSEKLFMYIMLLINPILIGSWRKYRGITGIDVAAKLIELTLKEIKDVNYVDLTIK